MKKIIFISALILMANISNAQCKFKKSIPFSNKICISYSKPEIIAAAPLEYLYRKDNAYAYLLCKAKDENVYLYINIATNWEKFEINETNPIVIQFDDNTEITIYPNGHYDGLLSGMQAFQIAAFYKISIEELEKLSKSTATNLQIFFTEDEKPNAYTNFNDEGLVYYTVVIDEPKKAEKLKEMANCMLNHK